MWAIIILILITGLIIFWISRSEQEEQEEYKQCYGCPSGFCMLDPGSPECLEEKNKIERWRKRYEQKQYSKDQ